MALLEMKRLKKYFSTPRGLLHAVDDVSMSIERGKTIGVVGESGCGKSTLGKTLIRMEDSTAGEVWFDGREITGMSQHEFKKMRMKMQMIFQDPYASLDPRMSIFQLIAEPIQTYKLDSGKKELDGGRRQRIGIARALSLDPEFIVCDEPVSALDVSIQAQILNLLMDLQEKKDLTYMFITHDMSVVKHISDDIAVMYLGQVVEKADYKELFTRPLHPYSQALFSAIPVPSLHNRRERIVLRGEITSPVNPKSCCRFAARCPYAADLCRQTEPELRNLGNDHFVKCHRAEEINN